MQVRFSQKDNNIVSQIHLFLFTTAWEQTKRTKIPRCAWRMNALRFKIDQLSQFLKIF